MKIVYIMLLTLLLVACATTPEPIVQPVIPDNSLICKTHCDSESNTKLDSLFKHTMQK